MRRRVGFFGPVVAFAVVLTSCDWPMFGNALDHARSSPDTTLDISNVGTLTAK